MNYFKAVLAILKKDILMEIRTKETINATLVFSILITIVFSFISEPGSKTEQAVAGGIFWMAVTFSGILGLNKTMMSEIQGGNFEALMLAPIDRSAIFFGKVISNFLFLTILEIILVPLFLVFYNVNLVSHWLMVVIILLATYGYSVTGTLFSMISVRTKTREIMLPLLMLPILVPVIIAAILSTNIFLFNQEITYCYNWIKLMAVFDIIFTAVIFAIFSAVIEE
ncbi:MAG: heme exporter protein CcmB [Mucispirillum sp.]|uniref:Heme exporter protein B n=1 Tax=Candidatus Mucispirillum faecigallinarum TaxID=2838699 RepID=A0A9D2GTF7_9BACT|nr:heme exporter protein CcmB [Mucispirillum sp.]HIZ88661.1 heme exporter protein CcmB [Candidatus Mucispirillum faecigallinarum]